MMFRNKTIRVVFGLIILFGVVKCSTSFFDNEIVSYSLLDLRESGQWRVGDSKPRYLPLNPTRYKYENGVIYANTNGFVSEFRSPKCKIFDLENWECNETSLTGRTYSHGYRNGKPWEYSSNPSEALKGYINVPYTRYWATNCQWLLEDNVVTGVMICAVSLFFLD